jgi:hypothetical protein
MKENALIKSLKSINADYSEVSYLIVYYNRENEEWFEYYKSLNPSYRDVSWLITCCKKAQTEEWFKYYKSLNPSDWDKAWLMERCPEAKEYFKN